MKEKNGHRPWPWNFDCVVKVSNWWTLKWTFVLSKENRCCGILMTLAVCGQIADMDKMWEKFGGTFYGFASTGYHDS